MTKRALDFRNEKEFNAWQDGRRTRWAKGDTVDASPDQRVAARAAITRKGSLAIVPAMVLPGSAAALTLILPWPPSGNHGTKHTTTGAHYLTEPHKRFRKAVATICMQVRARAVPSPYACEIVWHPPNRRRVDSDNLQKVVFDALIKAGVISDDSLADKCAYSETVAMPTSPRDGAVQVRLIAA